MPLSAEAGRSDGTESGHGRGDQGLRHRATTKRLEHWRQSDRMSTPDAGHATHSIRSRRLMTTARINHKTI
jgi:hypothetical protein